MSYNRPMDIIYADSLFFLNFVIDYLLLLATGRICSLPLRRWRLALSAAVGGIYAVAAVLWPQLAGLPMVKLAFGAGLVGLAFGRERLFLRRLLVFFVVSAAFGGAVHAACSLAGLSAVGRVYIPVSLRVLVLSFALCYAGLTLVFSGSDKRAARQLCRVDVKLEDKSVSFPALHDSGNELIDPVSGRAVLVAEAAAIAPLFPAGAVLDGDPVAAVGSCRGLRLLSCESVGGNSLLLCFTPDKVTVDGIKRELCVAVSAAKLSEDGMYQGLVGTF